MGHLRVLAHFQVVVLSVNLSQLLLEEAPLEHSSLTLNSQDSFHKEVLEAGVREFSGGQA